MQGSPDRSRYDRAVTDAGLSVGVPVITSCCFRRLFGSTFGVVTGFLNHQKRQQLARDGPRDSLSVCSARVDSQ